MATPTRTRLLVAALGGALIGSVLTAPAVVAAPAAAAHIEVLGADGVTPLGDTAVHEGDRIVVRGIQIASPMMVANAISPTTHNMFVMIRSYSACLPDSDMAAHTASIYVIRSPVDGRCSEAASPGPFCCRGLSG